jgi:hypothetical protein
MPDELTVTQQEESYKTLVKTLQNEIRTSRQTGGDILTRLGGQIKGWLLKLNQPHASERQVDIALGRGAAQGLLLLNFVVPVLGTALKTAAMKGLNLMEQHALHPPVNTPQQTLDQKAQWLSKVGAEQIESSILKLQHAHEDFSQRAAKSVDNCDDFFGLLHSYYYWQYRYERLLQRTHFLQQYAETLSTELEKVGNEMKGAQPHLDTLAKRIFGSYRWHSNCIKSGKECVYPWDKDKDWARLKDAQQIAAGKVSLPQGDHVKRPPPPRN